MGAREACSTQVAQWSGAEFSGVTPGAWMDANWRRFITTPDALDGRLAEDCALCDFQGLYFLWSSAGRLLYVGISNNIAARVQQHQLAGEIPFRSFAAIEAPGPTFGELLLPSVECAYIRGLAPAFNAHRGVSSWRGTPRMTKVIRRLWRQWRST